MRFPSMGYVLPAKAQTSLCICAVWSEPLLVTWLLHDCRATDRISFEVSKLTRRPHSLVQSTLLKMPHCWKPRVAAHFFKNKVMIIVFLNWANDIMLLVVIEMRMSDWMDFVAVISVCFKVQVPGVLFCLILYEVNFKWFSIWMFNIVNVNQSKRFEFLIKINKYYCLLDHGLPKELWRGSLYIKIFLSTLRMIKPNVC